MVLTEELFQFLAEPLVQFRVLFEMLINVFADCAFQFFRFRTGRLLALDPQLELFREDRNWGNLRINTMRDEKFVNNITHLLARVPEAQFFITVTVSSNLRNEAKLLQV